MFNTSYRLQEQDHTVYKSKSKMLHHFKSNQPILLIGQAAVRSGSHSKLSADYYVLSYLPLFLRPIWLGGDVMSQSISS